MTEQTHSRLSPSASEQWMNCPGSIAMGEKVEKRPAGPYAQEGTAAHLIAAAALNDRKRAEDVVIIEDLVDPVLRPFLIATPRGYKAPEDMAEHVQTYVDEVLNIMSMSGKEKPIVGVEHTFVLDWIHPGLGGTTDNYVFLPAQKELHVFDLKYGQGVVVEPRWNSQAMIYAIGAMAELIKKYKKNAVEKVVIHIVQPRAFHVDGPAREWEISPDELTSWIVLSLRPACVRATGKDMFLFAGDHCRFCDALAVCPEHQKMVCEIAKIEFANPIFPMPESLQPDDIAKIMKVSDLINVWSNEVKAYAQRLLEMGQHIPGFKLVQKKSNREWIDESVAEVGLVRFLGDDAFAPKKLLTIAQAEKMLKKKGLDSVKILEGLWEKPDNGYVMAPDTDAREQVAGSAMTAFMDSADFLQ